MSDEIIMVSSSPPLHVAPEFLRRSPLVDRVARCTAVLTNLNYCTLVDQRDLIGIPIQSYGTVADESVHY